MHGSSLISYPLGIPIPKFTTVLSHLNVLSLKCPRSGFLAGYFSQLNVLSVKCPKIVIFEKLCPQCRIFHCILSENRDLNVCETESLQCIFLG